MGCPFDQDAIEKLKAFTDVCRNNTDILHLPALSFFKEFIESFGGIIPAPKMSAKTEESKTEPKPKATEYESDPESDLELDREGCIDPDELVDIEMGGEKEELTDEEMEKAQELRRKAIEFFNEGKLEDSISTFSEAIKVDPTSALLFSKRGQAHLKLNKPKACIRDCTKALELNPDSAAAYKFRGRAYRLLGEWEQAAKDLRQACKIDFDEQSDEWLKEVTPNAKKIEQHRLRNERKKLEKEEREKLERIQKAREARAKAAQESQQQGNIPPMGNMPGMDGLNMGDFNDILKDPEVMAALQDPDVAAAFRDISSNPANLMKYQSNPKIMSLVLKLSSKMNLGAMGGGFPGTFPGAGFAPPKSAPPNNAFQDDNLD
ncbi:hsc70-interacting protein-like [Coccinella septempunctata]|uniref:hsc70-interacting protein-like n=1 Tax=Coccinella septempunctata TaxID=41139 RepID=UPI001D05F1EE|nr:hsc70-interacting protein-like [Coccinella septempunctata]